MSHIYLVAHMPNEIYIHNYKVMEKLGKGAFSTVFKGIHRINQKTVALKVSREKQTHETKILAYLNREFVDGVPTLFWYGRVGENTCIASTLYETTLQSYVENIWSSNFDPPLKMLSICVQLITILDNVHSAFIVHSDIKPDNFMVDSGGHVFIIDFGLSSLYYNVEKDVYKENKPCEHLIGSPKFASYNLHVGNSISPRDDMISLGYMMLSLFRIEIPWSNLPDVDSELPLYDIRHPSNIKRARLKRDLIKYLQALNVEKYLIPYFEKVFSLEFQEKPDYKTYREIFSTL
jgi:serine/threonine protein kinase